MRSIKHLALAVCLLTPMFGAPPIPRPGNDLTVTDAQGHARPITAYRGKVVLVQFLYTTCVHCQAAARMYSKIARDLGPRGFEVFGIAFNPEAQGNPDVIAQFEKQNGIVFPVGSAPLDTVLHELGASAMERLMVPQILVIDRHGMIRAQTEPLGSPQFQDESYVRSFVEGLLGEKRTSSSH